MKENEFNKVVIMLATYNGEKYIREQLDSIINNDHKNINLVISDDGSVDNTWKILEEYAKNYSFITLIKNQSGKHGAIYNFANLVKYTKAYIAEDCFYMFSDQDDVWMPDKIRVSVKALNKHNEKGSVLIYTGKQYVDKDLQYIYDDTINENIFDINIIHQNKTYGCTYILNSELMGHLESNIPHDFINYDHYVAVQAYLYGKVYYLPQKTILYRQHGDNVSGTINQTLKDRLKTKSKYKNNVIFYKFMINFCWKNRELLLESDRSIIDCLHKALTSRIALFCNSINCHIKKNSTVSTIQFYLAILFSKY